jgi:Cu(I)/Ag(I) efflux system membrane fusion protein
VKKSSLVLSLVAVAVIAAYGGYRTGQHGDTSNAATPNQASVAGEGKSERKVLYYRNPMGLPDTSPTPKKDSMGMDYIAVYEGDEPDGEGAVKVSPARLQTLGVKTAKAEMQVLDGGVRAVGRIEVDERQTYDIAPASKDGSSDCWSMPVAIQLSAASRCSPCIARNWSRRRRNWPLRSP